MNSNDKTKPVGKKAKKEPTIEDLLLEDDTSDSKVTNTSVLHILKDVKEKTNKSTSKEEVETKIDEIVEEKELSKKELKKQKKEEKKKNRRKFRNGEKLFILLNVIIIFYIMGFYAYRAYYYHKKLNLDVLKTMSLKEVATNIKNISFSGDGLYEDDENKIYYYKGKDVKNYVYFQGRIWQMLTIGDYIKMIQVDNVASIVAGIDMDYKSSYLHTWLDDYSKTIKDSENYLEETKWCSKEVDVKDYKCEEFIEGSVGLLTIEDYLKAGADSSFINSSEYFWRINYNDKKEFNYIK